MENRTDGDENGPPGEWASHGPRGEAVLADMTRVLANAWLLPPRVPAALEARLMTTYRGWAWGTDARWSPRVVYSAFGLLRSPAIFPACLARDADDFWMCGQRGHGVNSYAFGLLARVGPLVIAQHVAHGGIYSNYAEQTRRVNQASRAWASTLAKLEKSGYASPARYLVLFSDYHGYALIAASPEVPVVEAPAVHQGIDPSIRRGGSERLVQHFGGWHVAVSLGRDRSGPRRQTLDALVESEDSLLALAARHLNELAFGEPLVHDTCG